MLYYFNIVNLAYFVAIEFILSLLLDFQILVHDFFLLPISRTGRRFLGLPYSFSLEGRVTHGPPFYFWPPFTFVPTK